MFNPSSLVRFKLRLLPLYLVVFGGWLITCLVAANFAEGATTVIEETKVAVKFRSVSNDDFASFPINWPSEHKYLLGAIQSSNEYSNVFHPAAFAGNKKPFSPPAKAFETEMLVFVCKVIPAVQNVDKELRIEQISERGQTLEVRFTYRNSVKTASYQIKATAAVWIPKREFHSIKFYEDQKLVKELKKEDESWVFPRITTSEDSDGQ